MRIYDLLTHRERTALFKLTNGINVHSEVKTSNKRNSESFSDRELKDLMGTNRDTYKKVNGRVRKK